MVWSYLARFADDFIFLCNTEKAVAFAFEASRDFLGTCGLELNLEKSIVKELPRERFTFVDFRFILSTRNGKSKVFNIGPPKKLTAVLKKTSQAFKQAKTNEQSPSSENTAPSPGVEKPLVSRQSRFIL